MKLLLYFLLLINNLINLCLTINRPCKLRETAFGGVCVCNADYCDFLDEPSPSASAKNALTIISSSQSGLRFHTTTGKFNATNKIFIEKSTSTNARDFNASDIFSLIVADNAAHILDANDRRYFSATTNGDHVRLNVNRAREYQKIIGFGGAFTGAVSHVLQQLTQKLQDQIYRSFFAADGIGYNLLRYTIGGCDFDLSPWAYNEQPINDIDLSNFTTLDTRDLMKIQQILRLKEIAKIDDIKIMAAAWSPPKWMKSNNEWTGYSFLKTEYYQTWANYHLNFLELMAAKNMTIWAISTGNEPLNGVIGWYFVRFMSLGWTPKQQAIWLSEYLGPTIKNSKHKNVLIFGNDDQRYTYPAWFRTMKSTRTNSLNYLDGLAVHWYWDDVFSPNLIDETLRELPAHKLLLNTESCVGDKPWQTHGPELGSWSRGEQYMRSYMQDLQHNFNGWLDWNLILDAEGGPNYVKNHVDAPIIVNTQNFNEFYKQPIFYAIGHYSKFLHAGSVRIDAKVSNYNLDAIAFKRPDNSIAVVLYNSRQVPVDVTLNDNVRGNIVINIPERSMHTIVYN